MRPAPSLTARTHARSHRLLCGVAPSGEELLCNKGHHGPVYGVRFTPGGNTYASGGDDGTIRIWTYANGAGAGGDAAADEEGVTQ